MDINRALKIFGYESLEEVFLVDIKQKYKVLAKEKHPDTSTGSSDEFVKLREAYLSLLAQAQKVQSSSKVLKTLSKEEILKKYLQDTRDLQLKIELYEESFEEEKQTLENVKETVEDVIYEFQEKQAVLQKELEDKIAKLEKNYSQNLIQKILFFLPKSSEEEFWKKYQNQVTEYSKKHADLDGQFFKSLLATYGEGLNKIADIVNKKSQE